MIDDIRQGLAVYQNYVPPDEIKVQDTAPDGKPWIIREPNRPTPHAENGWQYHFPI